MRYTIHIEPIKDEKVAKLIARNIASRMQGVSFVELTDIIQHEKFTYAKNIKKDDLNYHKQSLEEQGVIFSVSAQPEEPESSIAEKQETPVQKATPQVKTVAINATSPESTASIRTKSSPKKITKKIIPVTLIVSLATIAILIFSISKTENDKRFTISQNAISKTSNSPSTSAHSTEPNSADPGSPESESRIYSDSADQKCGHSGHDAERLYRFAISYNPQNIDAWFGLLNCYRSVNKETEAMKIEKEMKEIFGPDVLNPQVFTQKYGLKEVLQIKDGAVSFVYGTEQGIDNIYSDLFQLARRFSSSATKYHTLTILAKRKDGSGIFMTLALGNCVTYRDFLNSGTFEELK